MFTSLPTTVRAVIFDAVGTLIFPNPGAAEVYAAVAAQFGLGVHRPEELQQRLWAQFRVEDAHDRADEWRTSETRERERWRSIVNAAIPGASDELFEALFQHFAQPEAWHVPDVVAAGIAEAERRGFILGMGSNYDSRLRSVVHNKPALRPLEKHLVISSEVGYRKPARQFFNAVCESVRCNPSEILFVGDDVKNDYEGAIKAGMKVFLVEWAR